MITEFLRIWWLSKNGHDQPALLMKWYRRTKFTEGKKDKHKTEEVNLMVSVSDFSAVLSFGGNNGGRSSYRTIGVTSPCLLQDLRGKTRFTWRLGRNLHDVLVIKPVNMQKDLSIDYYPHQGDRCANISCTWYAHIHVLYIKKMLYRVMSLLVNIKSDKTQIISDNEQSCLSRLLTKTFSEIEKAHHMPTQD